MKNIDLNEGSEGSATEDGEPPNHWPPGVKPISFNGLGHLGVDKNHQLYWDGKRLQTETKLNWVERTLAAVVAAGTASMAIFDALRFMAGD